MNDLKYSFRRSNQLLQRAKKVIPLGTQTFSKSYQQFPQDSSPLFLTKGIGANVWDVDGNKFIDLVAGLLPIILGYRDKDVDDAIKSQLKNGISFSMATELEIELSELLVRLIPSAEMVRFGKNGSDATSAAIRVARAYTGKERIMICGYHGWHDWYISKTVRNKGVPSFEGKLADRVSFNDIDGIHKLLKKHKDKICALIMEPANAEEPYSGYFKELHELLKKNKVLLIFDEIVTGFRFANGGAQELFEVNPDLSAFGKAMGNGMPISALVGKKKYMKEMNEIFYSTTFAGESLSICASIAVIKKMIKEPVIKNIWAKGKALNNGILKIIKKYDLENVIQIKGFDPWKLIVYSDFKNIGKEFIKTFVIKNMLSKGVLVNSAHNIMYSLKTSQIKMIVSAYEQTFKKLKDQLENKSLKKNLKTPPIFPVFSVRNN